MTTSHELLDRPVEQTLQERALLSEFAARASSEWVSPVALALIHVGLGEHEEALDQLERAYEQRAYRLVQLGVDERWDALRTEPRFRALVRKVGLPDAAGDRNVAAAQASSQVLREQPTGSGSTPSAVMDQTTTRRGANVDSNPQPAAGRQELRAPRPL